MFTDVLQPGTWVRYFNRPEPFGYVKVVLYQNLFKSVNVVLSQNLFKTFDNINMLIPQTKAPDLVQSRIQLLQILTKLQVQLNVSCLMN